MADISLTELVDLLSELFTNINNLDKTYYDMFYNTTPMDITLERYDENGVLQTYSIPNRAKDRDNVIIGTGDPEGQVVAPTGRTYIDTNTANFYYKVQDDNIPPNSSGWQLVFTASNIGDTFQTRDEKGQPNGYASLGEDGRVVPEQLPPSSLTFVETADTIIISIQLTTILTITSSNPNLEIENNFDDTYDVVGVITRVLTENTETTYEYNTDLVTITGNLNLNENTGVVTGFSGSNYLSTRIQDSEIYMTTSSSSTTDETLFTVGSTPVIISGPETTLTVTPSRPELVIENNYEGRKPVGTETITLDYRDVVVINNNACTIVGNLDTSNIVVSGFTVQNYISPTIRWNSSDTLVFSFTTGTDIQTGQALIGSNMSVAIKGGYLGYNNITDNEFSQVVAIAPETKYYIKTTYDSTNYTNIVHYSTDGSTWVQIIPSENNGQFILQSYAIGKGALDGQSDVIFGGSVTLNESYVILEGTSEYFASISPSWYEDTNAVELADYDLVLTSGTPVDGDVLTLVYTTTPPTLGSKALESNMSYMVRWNNTATNEFTLELLNDETWESTGIIVSTSTNNMLIGNGTFNGSINLLASTINGISLVTPIYTYRWYDENNVEVDLATYNVSIVSGTPQSGDTLTLVFTTTET